MVRRRFFKKFVQMSCKAWDVVKFHKNAVSACWKFCSNLAWCSMYVVVQLPSHVQFFVTLWTVAHQASLSFTISRSLPKFMTIESVMPSNYLILCHTLLLLVSIFSSSRVFSNESALHIRWLKFWSFSISPSNEYSGLISLWFKELSRVFSNTTVWKHQFLGAQCSLWSSSHICTWLLEKKIALSIWMFVGKVIRFLICCLVWS